MKWVQFLKKELIRKFAEQSNEEAGEHFTPRDVVKLMTELMFVENGAHLKEKNIIKTVYDPACGTGGMLTSCKDFITSINLVAQEGCLQAARILSQA